MERHLKDIGDRLNDIEELFDEGDLDGNERTDLEQEVNEIKEEVSQLYQQAVEAWGKYVYRTNDLNKEFEDFPENRVISDLRSQVKKIIKNNDFYDKDAVLSWMFPNRDDDDFDEDSMSYDSVFGED